VIDLRTEHLLTPHEVSNRLKVSLGTVYAWFKSGKLESERMSRILRTSEEALQRMADAARQPPDRFSSARARRQKQVAEDELRLLGVLK
jgi:excisionase family DNA binding protein